MIVKRKDKFFIFKSIFTLILSIIVVILSIYNNKLRNELNELENTKQIIAEATTQLLRVIYNYSENPNSEQIIDSDLKEKINKIIVNDRIRIEELLQNTIND